MLQSKEVFAFVSMTIPDSSDSCGKSLVGYQMGFNPLTGGDLGKPIFDYNANGMFDDGDNDSTLSTDSTKKPSRVIIGSHFDGVCSDFSFTGAR